MDQIGRMPKFDLDRELTDKEFKSQLKPYIPNQDNSICDVDEYLTTIKINSSYLELTDRCFCLRGTLAFIGLCALGLGLYLTIGIMGTTRGFFNAPMSHLAPVLAILAMCYGSAYIFLTGELFNLTHNPIRFNRRNRMVYAFLYSVY